MGGAILKKNLSLWVIILLLSFGTNIALGAANDCVVVTVEPEVSLGNFTPMTDMSEGGIGEVIHASFWKPIVPMLRQINCQWVRLDHIFDDSYYGLIKRNPNGQLQYDWTRFDSVIAEILASGAKPFFSLSYLPDALVKTSKYGPPKDLTEWAAICAELVAHMQSKYGLSGLYYEVWNEPNMTGFWDGTQDDYYQLYEYTYNAIFENDPTAKIGGPAGAGTGWISPFLAHLSQEDLKIDFVSWHHYSADPATYRTQINYVQRQLKLYDFTDAEMIFSEWNIDPAIGPANDSFYNAGHTAAVLGLFHELGLSKSFFFMPKDGRGNSELFGQWGAITFNNKPKPSFNVFDAYSRLKGNEIKNTTTNTSVNALTILDEDANLKILVWNYDRERPFGELRKVVIEIKQDNDDPILNGEFNQSIYLIDSQHIVSYLTQSPLAKRSR
jgi:xylan 1,4-beta-xylosidase